MSPSDLPVKPRLFVSYSHDSEAHEQWVRGLVERLRGEGFDVPFDLDEEMDSEQWPAWCKDRVDEAEFVLVVCTGKYRDRFEDTEALGESYGVKWEGHALFNELAWLGGRNYRIVPVLPPAGRVEDVPSVIRRTRRYAVEREEEYRKLVALLRDEERRRMLARWREWMRRRRELGGPLAAEEEYWVMPTQPEELLGTGIDVLSDDPPPSMLLNARYRAVEFVREARLREWDVLERWCDGGGVRVRLFHGPGGSGKTRLMQEWCIELRKRSWVAGFVPHGVSEAELEEVLADRRPVLLVVDYAESKPLGALMKVMLERFRRGQEIALRVAFVARNAGDWWEGLKGRDGERKVLLEWEPPVELRAIEVEGALRRRLFEGAHRDYARHRDVKALVPEVELDDARFERVLYLHAAALDYVERTARNGDAKPVASAADLLEGVLGHEQAFWLKRWRLPEDDLDAEEDFLQAARRTIGAITLRGGVPDPETARAVMDAVGAPRQPEDQKTHRRFERLCRTLYPGRASQGGDAAEREAQHIAPLEPDLLGEMLVERMVRDETVDDVELGFVDASEQTWETGFTVLGRVMERSGERTETVAEELLRRDVEGRGISAVRAAVAVSSKAVFSRLSRVATRCLVELGSKPLASRVETLVPEHTLSLAALGVWTMSRQLDGATEDERARLLNNLGNRQGKLGLREDALASMEEAVEQYRSLAKERPETYLPDLAMSLSNLGVRRGDLGQRGEALESMAEAVALYKILAEAQPDEFLPYLAGSLDNLGNRQSGLGRREDALASTAKAVEIRRGFAEEWPDEFLPDLATSLNNLGNRQSELGQQEEALASTTEAVEIRRILASVRPDAFLPDLATSLINLGKMQSDLGKREDALASSAEAVELCRGIAKEQPEAFLPYLAGSLNNLGNRQSELGQWEQALAATAEAVEIRRHLAKTWPNKFLPDLAKSLANLGDRQRKLAQSKEALASTVEAVALYRSFAEKWPDTFLPYLAGSLNNQGAMQSELGQLEDAFESVVEALTIYRKLFNRLPQAHANNFMISLRRYIQCLRDLGRPFESDPLFLSALETLKRHGMLPDE